MSAGLPSGAALAVDGRTVTYDDLIASGLDDGAWNREVERARRAVAVEAAGSVDEDGIGAAALAFRQAHALEAGADLRRWLDERGLDVRAWRRLVAGRAATGSDATAGRAIAAIAAIDADDPAELVDALRAETFASGYWHDRGREVARGLAARVLAGAPAVDRDRYATARSGSADRPVVGRPDDLASRLRLVRDGVAARAQLAARVDEGAVDARLDRQALAWTHLQVAGCRLDSLAAAREAVLCASVDGLGVAEVRDRSGGQPIEWAARAEQVPVGLAGRLLCAEAGQPIGPIEGAEGVDVLWVAGRHRPDAADPVLRLLAAERLVDERLDAWLVGRVRWLGPS